jgi:hypothetical protein
MQHWRVYPPTVSLVLCACGAFLTCVTKYQSSPKNSPEQINTAKPEIKPITIQLCFFDGLTFFSASEQVQCSIPRM